MVLVPILRAGLGMVEGVWGLMPAAQVWHIGLYRDEETLQPVQYYNKLPSEPTVSMVFVLDPMLATGGSAVATVDIVKKWGISRLKYMGILGAPENIGSRTSTDHGRRSVGGWPHARRRACGGDVASCTGGGRVGLLL